MSKGSYFSSTSLIYKLAEVKLFQTASAFDTNQRDNCNCITIQQYACGLSKIRKLRHSPKARTIFRMIFYRAMSTNEKESRTNRSKNIPRAEICSNCEDEITGNTRHIYHDCELAQRIWGWIEKYLKESNIWRVELKFQNTLYHQIPKTLSDKADFIISLLASGKIIIYSIWGMEPELPIHRGIVSAIARRHFSTPINISRNNHKDRELWTHFARHLVKEIDNI